MSNSYDFIVVGSGGGSMCAALAMRAAGKSVLILEKAALAGGTTATSGGVMWIPNNRFMKADGVADSREQAISYLNAVVGGEDDTPGVTPERIETYVDKSVEMLEFLISQGLKFRRVPSWPDYYEAPGESVPGRTVVSELFNINELGEWKSKIRPGFLPLGAYLEEAMELPNMKRSRAAKKTLLRVIGRTVGNRLIGRKLTTAGEALQGQMLNAAIKAGAEIRLNAPVIELVEENGRITGVIAQLDDNAQRFDARCGVLINAGGFARNQAMLDQYLPGVSAQWSNVIAEDTGDMIQEGLRLGAAIGQMDQRVGSPCTLPPEKPAMNPGMQGDLAKPHAILVDQSGQRYMRESASYMEIAKAMLERNKTTPATPSWMILDSQYLNTYMLAGTMAGKKKPEAWFEQNFLRQADSIEALASACELDPDALKNTVDRYNGFVDKGRDEDFGRGSHAYDNWLGDPLHEPSQTLGKIEQGPFYALPIYPGDVSTYGGLVTDEHARVLRTDGSVIEGLYATGTSTASVMGKASPGAGGSIGPSFTWGYVAAKHALAQA